MNDPSLPFAHELARDVSPLHDASASTTGRQAAADVDDALDTGTLGWLLPEIAKAFDAQITALRTFRAGAAGVDRRDVDLGPLRIARAHLHQAHGALGMVEVAGAPRLTSAIEDLLALFEKEPERCDATSLDAIVNGCRALVEYLEDLQGGAKQQPLHLFASYRELLAVQRVDRIQASDLFAVDPSVRAPQGAASGALDARRLAEQRAVFEKGLLRYLRNDGDARALEALERAVVAIEGSVLATVRQNQQRTFWWAIRAFFEALAHDGFTHVPALLPDLKRIAGRINLQIRKLVDGSPAVADRLFADVLFMLASAKPVTDRVRDVREAYRLDAAIPNDYRTQRYGLVDMSAVRRAREVLAEAKVAWSSIVAGDAGQIKAFARETGHLLDAVTPLKRRGLVDVAHIIDGIATELGFDPRQPAASVGLDVATALLFLEGALERARSLDDAFDARADAVVARVEASALGHDGAVAEVDWLDRISRKAEERLTMATFVGEMQSNLRTAEQTLDTFFRDTTQRAGLPETIAALGQVSGALALLGHDDAKLAVDASRDTIRRFESDLAAIDQAVFDRVAQNLGAVGFYVEQLKRERVDAASFGFDATTGVFSADLARHDAVIDIPIEIEHEAPPLALDFDEAVARETDPSARLEFSQVDDPALSFAATQVIDVDATLEDETAAHGDAAHALAQELEAHPEDRATRERLVAMLEEVQRNAALSDDRALQREAADALLAVRAQTTSVDAARAIVDRVAMLAQHAHRVAGDAAAAPVAPSAPVPAANDAAAVDAELLEIFLEEANLVLSDARDSLRVLDADPANMTAITAIRRGFHTLKGSGRMVGLMTFGDAAWAIEDTLNGFIAEQRPASSDLRALVEHAIRYLKDWVDDLARSGTVARVPDALIEGARAVRSGAALRLSDAQVVMPAAASQVAAKSRVVDPDTDLAPRPIVLDFDDAEVARAEDPSTTSHVKTKVDEDDFAKTMLLSDVQRLHDDHDYAATRVLRDDSDERIEIEFFGAQPQLPRSVAPDPSRVIADLASGEPETGDPFAPAEQRRSSDDGKADAFAKTIVLDSDDEDFAKTLVLADDEDDFAKTMVLAEDEDFAKTMLLDELAAHEASDVDAHAKDASASSFGDAVFPPLVFDEPVAAPTVDEADASAVAHDDADASTAPTSEVADSTAAMPSTVDAARVPRDDLRRIGSLTVSSTLFNIYLNEADDLLRILSHDFAEWRTELDRFVSEAAIRAAHSLAGSSATVGIAPVHDLAAVVEEVLQHLWREPTLLVEPQVVQLQDAVESLRRMLHRFAAERMPEADVARVQGLHALRDALANVDRIEDEAAPVEAAASTPGAAPIEDDAVVVDAVDDEGVVDADGTDVDAGDDTAGRDAADVDAIDVDAAGVDATGVDAIDVDATGVDAIEADAFDAASMAPLVDDGLEAVAIEAESSSDDEARHVDPVESGEPIVADETIVDDVRHDVDAIVEVAAAADDVEPTAAIAEPARDELHEDATSSETIDDDEAGTLAIAEPTIATDVEATEDTSDPVEVEGAVDSTVAHDDRTEPLAEAAIEQPVDASREEAIDRTTEAAVERTTEAAVEPATEAAVEPATEAVTSRLLAAERTVRDELDPELLDVFVAEGAEILPQIGELLRGWQARPADRTAPRQLLRHLHTLKGSARMAGAMRLGEVAHEIESRVESAARLHDIPPALLEELLAAHDRSVELFDEVQHPPTIAAADPAAMAAPTSSAARSLDAVTTDAASLDATPQALPDAAMGVAANDRDEGQGARTRDGKATRQQAVRVGAETLDRLVNLAGEVSISRARIENEVTQIKSALSDLGDNVERLKSQLREIELQAEFQLQSRMQSHPSTGSEGDKFDPLEFDRFTRFQELTRMMAESVNDVKTVQHNLQKSLEGAEVDLSSQRRMTRDLQQDLMSVRMVPFGSIAERLYRVARRAAKEVDKRVNLDIRGGSVEIDRGVLERMAGPFEHLLRNHIVHGIETRAARRAAGKDETGELMIEVRQEGNEMALTFSDDGAGIDHERIRAKARALGLIGEGQTVSDAASTELIFHPGFSTASEVTELAGRGIGMDVVRAEAALLGGRVSVESEHQRGTRFTINLPLTLAVTQVVLVSVADRVFALPSVLVEQVQQLRPQPLAEAYRMGSLDWAGERVRLAFLGSLLGIEESVAVAQRSSPVLVLRSAGERIAVHVDAVIGNQEVVVKNLGPQLSRMSGIAGATVLGSGEIVLILNPVQLALTHRTMAARDEAVGTEVRSTSGELGSSSSMVASTPTSTKGPLTELQTLPTVMVVDDSLTVRRVTQRLLSREGYQVVLAKDGVDALEQLQDFPPDAMLVDIEMPRMDGFDLTRHVRGDTRFKSIPIVMITSRNADKHRDHALELGVDAYLGKPYQEDELLELLARFVKEGRGQPA